MRNYRKLYDLAVVKFLSAKTYQEEIRYKKLVKYINNKILNERGVK